jgi:membrane protease YdiL (CAAX protease family)
VNPAAVRHPNAATIVAASGCALLMLRPVLFSTAPADATLLAVALFAALLAAGALWPASPSASWVRYRVQGARAIAPETLGVSAGLVLAAGGAAFALARVVGGGHPPVPFAARFILLNALAAVAEEAFFRRLVYGALARHGAAFAVAGSSLLFAAVHFTVYGAWVLPVDLAAGLLFGWQRWATGRWTVPAVTHVLANLLVVI